MGLRRSAASYTYACIVQWVTYTAVIIYNPQ